MARTARLKRPGVVSSARRSDWKKAYVTLREGQKMPEFRQGA